MKIRIDELRSVIRVCLLEAGGGMAFKPQPYHRNALSPAVSSREELGKLKQLDIDTELDGDTDVSAHLRDVIVTPEECYGPVPPVQNDPYTMQDPMVQD